MTEFVTYMLRLYKKENLRDFDNIAREALEGGDGVSSLPGMQSDLLVRELVMVLGHIGQRSKTYAPTLKDAVASVKNFSLKDKPDRKLADHLYAYYELVFRAIGLGDQQYTGSSPGTQVMINFRIKLQEFVAFLEGGKGKWFKPVVAEYRKALAKLVEFEAQHVAQVNIQYASDDPEDLTLYIRAVNYPVFAFVTFTNLEKTTLVTSTDVGERVDELKFEIARTKALKGYKDPTKRSNAPNSGRGQGAGRGRGGRKGGRTSNGGRGGGTRSNDSTKRQVNQITADQQYATVNVNGVFEGGNSYVPLHGTVDQYCLPSAMVSAQINNLANESPDPELNYKTADMSPWEYIQCIQNGLVCAMQHGGLRSLPQCFPFGMRQSPCCRCLSTDHAICESDVTKAAEWFKKGFLEMKGALRKRNTVTPPATHDWVKTWKKPAALKGSAGGAGGGRGNGRGRGRGRGGGRSNGR